MILLLVQWFCKYMAQHTLHNRSLTLDPAESYRQVQDQKQLSHLQQKRIENRKCHLRNQIIMINSSTVRNNWFYFSIFVLQGQKRPKFHLLTYKSHFNDHFCACLNHTPLLSSEPNWQMSVQLTMVQKKLYHRNQHSFPSVEIRGNSSIKSSYNLNKFGNQRLVHGA